MVFLFFEEAAEVFETWAGFFFSGVGREFHGSKSLLGGLGLFGVFSSVFVRFSVAVVAG